MEYSRAERLTWNEALFRKVNEISDRERLRHGDEQTTILCECARLTCDVPLNVSLEEFHETRKHPARFLVYPGHEVLDIERVTGGDATRFLVVEKVGFAGELAESLAYEGRDVVSEEPEPNEGTLRRPLRVLVVDDHEQVRLIMRVSLAESSTLLLVGEAENGEQAIAQVEMLHPDIVVMDMEMPIKDGVATTREITARWRDVAVVGFTSGPRRQAHQAMTAAGAVASFDKGESQELLQFLHGRGAAHAGRPEQL